MTLLKRPCFLRPLLAGLVTSSNRHSTKRSCFKPSTAVYVIKPSVNQVQLFTSSNRTVNQAHAVYVIKPSVNQVQQLTSSNRHWNKQSRQQRLGIVRSLSPHPTPTRPPTPLTPSVEFCLISLNLKFRSLRFLISTFMILLTKIITRGDIKNTI